ncbi:MAG: DUF934 domain-containing protein [Gammaproteobacteria bacterium]|nr:DUF934 domain-containing protein [Gammaproteobacteria bacterium]
MGKHIIKNRQIVEDNWQHLADEESLPASGDIIINYRRWQENRGSLKNFSGRLGITIGGEVSAETIKDDLAFFQLIAIAFAEFKDGRGYSYARLLRERYGFQGELRAIGNILQDQIYYLHRCGFDSFDLDQGRDINAALKAFSDFGTYYQPAVV